MDLAEILASMVTDEGLSIALIVGGDGLLVEGQCQGAIDLPAVGAMASRTLNDLHHLGRSLSAGTAVRLRLPPDSMGDRFGCLPDPAMCRRRAR